MYAYIKIEEKQKITTPSTDKTNKPRQTNKFHEIMDVNKCPERDKPRAKEREVNGGAE